MSQQQDSQEFFQKLCERLEHANKNSSSGSSSSSSHEISGVSDTSSSSTVGVDSSSSSSSDGGNSISELFKNSIGGMICNQVLRSDPTPLPTSTPTIDNTGTAVITSSDIREKEEDFVCISLQVGWSDKEG